MKRACWGFLGLMVCVAAHAQEWNFGWEGNGQGQWSGSDPQEFIVGTKPCSFKVRGRSGVWAEFAGEIPPGKIVVGVVNPREPDIIFFQLKKQSPFLFASKRTCFQGETPYVEDAIEAARKKKLSYWLAYGSYLMTRSTEKISSSENYTTVGNNLCGGVGKEWVTGFYRIYAAGCLGIGTAAIGSSRTGELDTYDSISNFIIPAVFVGGYYDLPGTPYAAGLEFGLSFSMTRTDLANSEDVATAKDFAWMIGMGWRFYYDNWMFVPKVGIWDRVGTKYFEFQIGYLFQ